jgi:DNA-binding transcriptional LysR family regulator
VSIFSLDLNLLVTLDAVLAEASVGRAARRLHVTQSAVSNALARLRVALDDPLLVRSGRGVVPTPRAAALAPAIGRALQSLEQAIHGEAFDPATTERQLTLAIADVGQLVRLPKIAADLSRAMPRARLRVVSIDALLAMGGLAGSEVDVLVGAGDHGPGIHHRPLYEERIVLVARAGNRTIGARLSKRQLAAVRHVEVQITAGRVNQRVAAAYAALGVPREIAVVVPAYASAAAVVGGSDLVASMPESLLGTLGRSFGLRRIATPLPPVTTPIDLLWHQRTDQEPALRFFRDLLVTSVGPRPPVPAV